MFRTLAHITSYLNAQPLLSPMILLVFLSGVSCVQAEPVAMPAASVLTWQRYADAQLVEQEQASVTHRVYPMGLLRRISGRLRLEEQASISGEQSIALYQLPAWHTELEAFELARQNLLDQGAVLLFWCQGSDCGASDLWANLIFKRSSLYGLERQQAYLLARLPQSSTLVAVYAATRGTGQALLYIEQLEAADSIEYLLPTADTLLRQLRQQGFLSLPSLPEIPDPAWVQRLARLVQLDSRLYLKIEGQAAESWYKALEPIGGIARRLEWQNTADQGLYLRFRE